jgi:hypothetical protein
VSNLSISKAGIPIRMPSFFASEERAMTHPSLLDNTTTGLLRKEGLNTLSQEA